MAVYVFLALWSVLTLSDTLLRDKGFFSSLFSNFFLVGLVVLAINMLFFSE
ncbi:hypothetical protein [uncultured Methylophaga sp.]|uniref:hypothetical protein n=1 Tax=uncultured Methylophaga sp. TaxID=285271 RepID=UPI0026373578|nr:hypothetical protein [uncultured Methylophaga sp.]